MKATQFKRLSFYIGLIFGVFLFGLIGKELITSFSSIVLAEQDLQLEHNWELYAHQKNISVLLRDAELGMYAYFSTGNRSLLPHIKNIKNHYDEELRFVTSIPMQNAAQRNSLVKFQELSNRHFQQVETEAIVAGQEGAGDKDYLPLFMKNHWERIQALRDIENIVETQQLEIINLEEKKIHERYWCTLLFCLMGSVVLLILFTIFYKMNCRYSASLNNSKNELKSKNDDLKNDIALRVDQLTELSHHLLAVSEQEKASLARELHDELGSNLTAMRLDLLTVLERFKDKDPSLAAQIKQTLEILQRAFQNKRRIIENLRPSSLEVLGFATAIKVHTEEVAQRSGLKIDVKIDEGSTNVDPDRSIAMYRIVQEALTNTVKYAKAKHVSISLTRNMKGLNLHISDDGIGFAKNTSKRTTSHGILGMRERATLLGGSFDIRSCVGYGTHIEVFLPYPEN